jgi:hypothetical protein
MNFAEAQERFRAEMPIYMQAGVSFEEGCEPACYLPEEFRYNIGLAMDAQPALTTAPSAAIPAIFTTWTDPKIYEVLFAKNAGAEILGEVRKGDWTMDTALFPIVEHAGEVTSYGDYNEDGTATANANWPNRQNYIFQTMKQYGERELARAGVARLNWISEIDASAVTQLDKFANLSYFYGIGQLSNYGLLNDPNLSAYLTPAPKAFGNNKWVTSGVVTATANEIFADIQSMYLNLVLQSAGLTNAKTKMTLGLSPQSEMALTQTNSFNVNVEDLLKKNFPSLRVVSAVQYGALTTSNPQGSAGGEVAQMIADMIEGQEAGFCAYSEKLRSHTIIKAVSSFKQKQSSGTWGAIVRQPFAFTQMIGI